MSDERAGILVVDDEFSVRDSLEHWFRRDGYRVGTAQSGEEALGSLQRERWDVVLADIRMPGMDGLELQRRIHRIDPEIAVIVITAYASVESAVQALKDGAFDYVAKPIDPDELSHLVKKAVENRRLRDENLKLKTRFEQMAEGAKIVGESAAMREVMALVASVAGSDSTVLIQGESGTGKELVAQAIHAASPRRFFSLVPVNCGALAETLLESELFGHEKGAFTGAQYRRKGRLELADGGTLFLDEIGTLSPKTQVDLLRVLETHQFTRLGGNKEVEVDFRVICATNQDLEELVRRGEFREDLYYRINVVAIRLPPLRERRGDIPLLVRHFLEKYTFEMNRPFQEVEREAMELLSAYDWPGNVRELANALERAMVLGEPPVIRLRDLPQRLREMLAKGPEGDSLAEIEEAHVRRILVERGWNVTRAAKVLGIDRVTLYNKMKKYGIERPAEAPAKSGEG